MSSVVDNNGDTKDTGSRVDRRNSVGQGGDLILEVLPSFNTDEPNEGIGVQ